MQLALPAAWNARLSRCLSSSGQLEADEHSGGDRRLRADTGRRERAKALQLGAERRLDQSDVREEDGGVSPSTTTVLPLMFRSSAVLTRVETPDLPGASEAQC